MPAKTFPLSQLSADLAKANATRESSLTVQPNGAVLMEQATILGPYEASTDEIEKAVERWRMRSPRF